MIKDAEKLNSLVLAYVGDAVFSLWVRTRLVEESSGLVQAFHNKTSAIVNAKAQAEALSQIEGLLNQTEADVVRRGRNAHTGSKAKNASIADYHRATAFEALLGYLYLSGQTDRLQALLSIVMPIKVDEQQRLETLTEFSELNTEEVLEFVLGLKKDKKE